jgi:hypothetical protein
MLMMNTASVNGNAAEPRVASHNICGRFSTPRCRIDSVDEREANEHHASAHHALFGHAGWH